MSYKTVKELCEALLVEKRSKFYSYIKPVASEDEAVSFINEMKTKYWDSKHVVYAYRLLENNISRFSDAGEPSGTAGKPVLEILQKEDITNAVIVVIRYFGGILLGTGGLVRAYSNSARDALMAATVINMTDALEVEICCDYSMLSQYKKELEKFKCEVTDTEYSDLIKLKCLVPADNYIALINALSELSSGNLTLNKIRNTYIAEAVNKI